MFTFGGVVCRWEVVPDTLTVASDIEFTVKFSIVADVTCCRGSLISFVHSRVEENAAC